MQQAQCGFQSLTGLRDGLFLQCREIECIYTINFISLRVLIKLDQSVQICKNGDNKLAI